MPKKTDPRRLRSSLTYTVLELANALDRNPGTIRGWIKQGLPVLNSSRPTLILGSDAKDFLTKRQNAAKRPLKDDELLCLTCHEPRRPFEGLVDLHSEVGKPSRIVGFCEACEGVCSRVVGKAQIAQLSKFFEVQFHQGHSTLKEARTF